MNQFVNATYERLDPDLETALAGATDCLAELRWDIVGSAPPKEDEYLWRWAMFYMVVLEDLSRTLGVLMPDGAHSRAVIMLRRTLFEYQTRFAFYRKHPDQAKLAMDEYTPKMEAFAKRLKPDEIAFGVDPAYDAEAFRLAKKRYANFEHTCNDVHAQTGDHKYATFYSYPSALLHGWAMLSNDILEGQHDGSLSIHLDSRRPFTNGMADNCISLLLDFVRDARTALRLGPGGFASVVAAFKESRERRGVTPY